MKLICNDVIDEVVNRLERGEKRKDIMAKLDLSKTFVARIARGDILPNTRREVPFGIEQIKDMELFNRSYSRCKVCRCMVQKPCLKCALDDNNTEILEYMIMSQSWQDSDIRQTGKDEK